MKQAIEIVKQVKLTAAQRIAIIAAANNQGVLKDASHDAREVLRYLGLVAKFPQHTKAEIEKETVQAWADLRKACSTKDARKAEDAVSTIRGARWKSEREVWKLTPAANEYLLRGRVIVTTSTPQKAQKSNQPARLSA